MKNTLFYIAFFLAGSSGFAQQDTSYIRDFRDYGNLSLALESKANSIGVIGPNGEFLRFRTNNGFPTYGIMFSYKWLNAWLTTSAGPLTYAQPRRGKTENFGLALGYTGDHWWLRAFVEDYKGYYITNPEVFAPNWFEFSDDYPILPDLQTFTFYGTAYYGFNEENYSHRAMLWQSQEQKRSSGSWLMGVSMGYDHIYSDSAALIPPEASFVFSNLSDISGYETYTTAINVGYTHSFALFNRWSLGLMFAPGIAGSFGEIESVEGNRRAIQVEFGAATEARATISYHHDRWYGGVAANAYLLTKPVNGELFNNLHTYIRFNVGYRLTMPKSKFLRRFGLSD